MNNGNDWKFLAGCLIPVIIILCFCSLVCFGSVALLSTFSDSISNESNAQPIKERYLDGSLVLNDIHKDKIAIINVTGAITYSVPGSATVETGATSKSIISQLDKAYIDDSVKVVLIRLNTPGGEVLAGKPICDKISEVSTKKRVYSFSDSSATSLGYYIASCTDYIYARKGTQTASIGVIAQATDLTGILINLGGRVQSITNTQGTQKTGDGIFDENSETYKQYQKILDETYNEFIDVILAGRKGAISKEKLLEIADGRVVSGQQALDLKLVDELGEFNQVIDKIYLKAALNKQSTDVVEYDITQIDPFSYLFPQLSAKLDSINPKSILENSNKVNLIYK